MLHKTLIMIAAGLACAAAGPKPATHAAKPAVPSQAAASSPLDVRDPANLVVLLAGLAAKAEVTKREGDAIFLTVTSPTEVFSVQFAGCDAQGRNCQALLFDRQGVEGQPTAAQLNSFNQTSVMCRTYQDKSGVAHLEYSALLFAHDGKSEMLTHLAAWRGCIGDFRAFLKDPTGYLAGAA